MLCCYLSARDSVGLTRGPRTTHVGEPLARNINLMYIMTAAILSTLVASTHVRNMCMCMC